MLKLVIDETLSPDLFIGLYGTNVDEIETQYNLYFNYGVTGGELHWLHENTLIDGVPTSFAYFSTSQDQLTDQLKGLYESRMMLDAGLVEPTVEISKVAAQMAEDFFYNTKRESFVAHLRATVSL